MADLTNLNKKSVLEFREKKVKLFGEIGMKSTEMFFKIPKGLADDQIQELINDMHTGLIAKEIDITESIQDNSIILRIR